MRACGQRSERTAEAYRTRAFERLALEKIHEDPSVEILEDEWSTFFGKTDELQIYQAGEVGGRQLPSQACLLIQSGRSIGFFLKSTEVRICGPRCHGRARVRRQRGLATIKPQVEREVGKDQDASYAAFPDAFNAAVAAPGAAPGESRDEPVLPGWSDAQNAFPSRSLCRCSRDPP